MRVITLILCLVWVPALQAQALQESLRLFDAGTASIQNGQYVEAIEAFDQALAAGYESAALHYNRGIALYRLDRLGPAIASFERARRLDPDHREVTHNLSIARARIRDRMSVLPRTFTQSVWLWLDRSLGARLLFLIGLSAYLVWVGIQTFRVLGRRYTDWHRRGVWAAGAVATLGLLLGLGLSMRPAEPPAAVIIADEAPVFPDATATSSADFTVHEGVTVSVIGRSGDWTAVRLPNGVTGWVSSDQLLSV